MTRPAKPSALNIRIVGLKEIQKKLGADVLLQPEFDDALATFVKRFMRKGRKRGMGAKRNLLSSKVEDLSVIVESSLNYPRTVGEAWGKENWKIANAMAPRVLKKMVKRIQERWSS